MMALSYRLIFRNLRRNFHSSQCNSLFYEPPDKDGFKLKSDAEKDWEKLSFAKRLRLELNLWKIGLKQWYNEFIGDALRGPRLYIPENEVDVIWRFNGDPKELDEWVITCDKDHNLGYSSGQIDFTPNSKGLFHGFLDTKVPPDGVVKRSGFCNLKLLPRLTPFKNTRYYDWEGYTHLVLRVRGDGRVYAVNLHLEKVEDVCSFDTFHYFIWTRGGPYWQYIRIPFSKFFFAYKGRIQVENQSFQSQIGTISFTIGDKITGPFRLEIDYIGVENDPSHIEECAYESYAVKSDERYW